MKDFFQYRESLVEAKNELTPVEKKKIDRWLENEVEGGPDISDVFDLGNYIDKKTYNSWLHKKLIALSKKPKYKKHKLSVNDIKSEAVGDPSDHYKEDGYSAIGLLPFDKDDWNDHILYQAEEELLMPRGRPMTSKKHGDDGVEYLEGRGKKPSVLWPPYDGASSKSPSYCFSKLPVPKNKIDAALEHLTDTWF